MITFPHPMPLLTLITPSYNQAAFLEDTIRSVLGQEGVSLEYMIVDGGSTDGSQEIIRRYASRLAWWVSGRDSGQAEAINKGLARANGEIVAWLNSDDLYLPGAAASAVAALQADPSLGLVFGDAVTIDPSGRPLNPLRFGEWGLAELMRFRIICQPAVFMRRSVLEQAGFLDPSYHFMLDHHLWLRMARLAPVRHIPCMWAAARHHPGAKNVAQAPAFGREAFRIVDWMQTTPDFAPQFQKNRRKILGGAYRLNARYLLDGGLPGPSLRSYSRALFYNPSYALQHAHRMLYALFCLVGAGSLANRLVRVRQRSRPDLSGIRGINGWPGILLQEANQP